MKKLIFTLLTLIATTGFNVAKAQPGKYLSFDPNNNNSLVECGVISEDYNSFAIEAWISLASYKNDNYILCNEGWGDGGFGLVLRTSEDDDHKKLLLKIGASDGWKSIKSTNEIALNTWTHVAVSFDGTTFKMYIDGIENATATSDKGINKSTEKFVIGEGAMWRGRRFDGKIGDVRFWNIVRTQQELADHKDNYLATAPNGLIANWKLNEGSGDAINELTGNYNATKGSGTTWGVSTAIGDNTNADKSFSAFYNETQELITLSNKSDKTAKFQLVNLSGKVVRKGELNADTNKAIGTNGLSKGVFIVIIRNENGSFSQKLVLR
ncbi:MAG: T9SS type A sorting domain-containing protein [Carboxylicivirga sp.]|jgi:hypothetical protein|nr:T9SS type A sorting domain-containing protein [Carboxylicivirga sp.]